MIDTIISSLKETKKLMDSQDLDDVQKYMGIAQLDVMFSAGGVQTKRILRELGKKESVIAFRKKAEKIIHPKEG